MSQATTQLALQHLRQAGFFIVAWTPEEVAGVADADLETLEDALVTKGNDFIAEHTYEDEDNTCPLCGGCGEGMYDGSRCGSCGGKGVIRQQEEWSE
jgi:hypothetical protein